MSRAALSSTIKAINAIPKLQSSTPKARFQSTMTTGVFKYIDPASYTPSTEPFVKPWGKVDGPGRSFRLLDTKRSVQNIRGQEQNFSIDTSGFAVYKSPAATTSFADDSAVRNNYYPEVEALIKAKLHGVKKVTIFDHTIRRHDKASPRQPVQQVHVDQTPGAAEARVRRHLPPAEAELLLQGRFQIVNVWRPIAHAAEDFPLAVVDWRSTTPADFVPVDLLYPQRANSDNDDRGKEQLPDPESISSHVGYEIKGETFAVRPSEAHRFYYVKDMTPEEAMFIKCFDSRGEGLPLGKDGLARCTPHTAFVDPATRESAPGRESIEVRCLVFYE